jgi:hypothetical protein
MEVANGESSAYLGQLAARIEDSGQMQAPEIANLPGRSVDGSSRRHPSRQAFCLPAKSRNCSIIRSHCGRTRVIAWSATAFAAEPFRCERNRPGSTKQEQTQIEKGAVQSL